MTAIHRFRGCFLGGPLHGEALPAQIRGPRLVLPVHVEGEEPLTFTWVHRRLESTVEAVIESVEFLVLDLLGELEAEQLAQAERERRGGWGEPLLTLPAAGFTYSTEGVLAYDDAGNATGLAGFGTITRYSPDGVALALHLADESRGLFVEEADPMRCEYCGHGIGHTLELHRARLENDAAEARMLRAMQAGHRPPAPVFHPLHLALVRAQTVDEDLAYCMEASEALALEDAHRAFLANRQAELEAANAPRIILPAGVR